MADKFLQRDTTSLLDNRFIVVIGDSNMRGVYKDIVLLLQKNQYLQSWQLKKKGEKSFEGDRLIEGGKLGEMSNGVNYREVRQYQTDYHLARFYFVTRCYNSYMESILADLSKEPRPDVVLLNSCLWDISRYGAMSVDEYKENLETLFRRLKESLPENCLVIWLTTLPISKRIRGGFLIPEIEFRNSTLRLDVLEANFFVHKLMTEYGFDILDLHYFLRHQLQRRADDGVHWDNTAHRRISNLILSHIADAWGIRPLNGGARLSQLQENNRQLNRACYNNQNNRGTNINNFQEDNTANQCLDLMEIADRLATVNNNMNNRNNFNPAMNMGFGLNQNFRQVNLQQVNLQQEIENMNRYGGPIRRPAWDTVPQINQMPMNQFQWEPYQNLNNNLVMKQNAAKMHQIPYRQVQFHRNRNHW